MRKLKNIIILTLILSSSIVFAQETERWKMTEKQAKEIVNEALSDSTLHNVIGITPILTDEKKVIEFAELILWGIYGKKNIEKQKPYHVFEIDKYWLLRGTLPKGMKGGTFMIIIDSRDCRILRLTHGK
jgi:NTF2 fold immunity protein